MPKEQTELEALNIRYFRTTSEALSSSDVGENDIVFTDDDDMINPFSLLDYKYSELEITNASWLIANGEWDSKSIYPDVYEKIKKIGKNSITYQLKIKNYLSILVRDTSWDFEDSGNKYYAWTRLATGDFFWTLIELPKTNDAIYYRADRTSGEILRSPNDIEFVETIRTDYTDYDFVYDEDDETFRLPLKTKTSFVIEEGEENGIKYRIWNDGYCEQEGIITGISPTVNFAKVFKDTSFVANWIYQDNTNSTNLTFQWQSINRKTVSSMQIHSSQGTSFTMMWKASGYLATDQYKPQKLYYYVGATLQNKTSINISGVLSELSNKLGTDSPLVANNRFDGKFVNSELSIDTKVSTSLQTYDLSNYLPKDNFYYDIYLSMATYQNDELKVSVGSDATFTPTSADLSGFTYHQAIHGGTYSRQNANRFNIVIGPQRKLYVIASATLTSNIAIGSLGYRRIGTNE